MSVVIVTRDVAADEPCNYLGRAVSKGERFYTFHEPTYGAVDDINGIALSETTGQYPFFEFPRDAVEVTP
jgi:hypothetical protein